jgi:hypothetical protein
VAIEEDPEQFLADRKDWLKAIKVKGQHGGWDIAIRIDGEYFDNPPVPVDDMLLYWQERVAELKRVVSQPPPGISAEQGRQIVRDLEASRVASARGL